MHHSTEFYRLMWTILLLQETLLTVEPPDTIPFLTSGDCGGMELTFSVNTDGTIEYDADGTGAGPDFTENKTYTPGNRAGQQVKFDWNITPDPVGSTIDVGGGNHGGEGVWTDLDITRYVTFGIADVQDDTTPVFTGTVTISIRNGQGAQGAVTFAIQGSCLCGSPP